jgi:hypothetical protein
MTPKTELPYHASRLGALVHRGLRVLWAGEPGEETR